MADLLRPMAPLILTPDARRVLALVLMQADDERVLPADGDEDVAMVLGLLADLGLVEIAAGGYVATDHLRSQPWARELMSNPFPD